MWWGWDGGFVGFADSKEGNGELSVGGNTFEDCVAEFEEFLPVWELPVEEFDATIDYWLTEECETETETGAFDDHVWVYEERN